MKRLTIILAALCSIPFVACQNQDLIKREGPYAGHEVLVRVNWREGLPTPERDGVRINIFSLDEGVVHYGRADVPHYGSLVRLTRGATYKTYAYNYVGNNVRFRNETDPAGIEATSSALVRATYSRAFPDEATIGGIEGDMHVGANDSYTVAGVTSDIIDVYPDNIVTTYTYEVRGVRGAEFIRAARGAISGMSASYFLATETLSEAPSTVLFDGSTVDVVAGEITGSFRTFGRVDATDNMFTIEVLFPSQTPGSGIVQKTWDVTSQIEDGGTHIIIDNADLEIPDEGGEEADGWDVDLSDWNDEIVELN